MKASVSFTTVVLIAIAGAASGQSVLERVLQGIDNTNLVPVTGTFANIAENIGGGLGAEVDASITNAIAGVGPAVAQASQTASAGSTVAYQFDLPTAALGDLSTTALGAVNTGTIVLGVDATVDEAKTEVANVVSAVLTQLSGVLVLNIASNTTGVNASVSNTISDIGGTIGSISTTALGAVNTGTITIGVNSTVQGIVGLAGQ